MKWLNITSTLLLLCIAAPAHAGAPVGPEAGGSEHDSADEPENFALEPTVVSYTKYRDPLIKFNRAVFAFNDVAFRYVLIPVAKGYRKALPDPVERCIGNFFHNLKTPIYTVNHLLQRNPKPMGRTLLRFGINTTVGVLGLFDPARSRFDLAREEVFFNDTLAHYGAGYGFYLVIPILGSSDIRRAGSSLVDSFLNPITYLVDFPFSTIIQGYDNFHEFAPRAKHYGTVRSKSRDPYIFFRNFYLQGVQRDDDYRKSR